MASEVICAWCKKVLSPGNKENGASHSICESCQQEVQNEIMRYVNKQNAKPTQSNSINWYKLAAPPMPLDEIPDEEGGKNIDSRMDYSDINYIERKYKLDRKLGEGMIGTAYLTRDNKVLKITPSKQEYDYANFLQNDTYAPVVKIYKTEFLENSRVYLILKDRVKQLTEEEQSVLNSIDDCICIIEDTEALIGKKFPEISSPDIATLFAKENPVNLEKNQKISALLRRINLSGIFGETQTAQDLWAAISFLQENAQMIEKASDFHYKISNFSITDIRGENCGWDKNGDIVAFDFGNTIEEPLRANNTFNLKRFSQTNQSKKQKGLSKYEIKLLERINGYYDEDKYSEYYDDDDGTHIGNALARDDIYHMYTDSDDGGSELEPLLWWHDGVRLHVADEYGGTHSSNFGGYDWRYFYHGRYSKKINLITAVVPQHLWNSKSSQTLNEKAWIRRDEKAIDVIADLRDHFGQGPDIAAII